MAGEEMNGGQEMQPYSRIENQHAGGSHCDSHIIGDTVIAGNPDFWFQYDTGAL